MIRRVLVLALMGLAVLLLLPRAGAHGQDSVSFPLDQPFARILELEDRRSTGSGELAGFLSVSHPLPVRVRAALAVGRIGAPVTTPYDLTGALHDAAPELRRMAAFALGEMDDPRAAPLLAAALEDSDAHTRAMAAEALGKLKDPQSVPSLMAHLKDPDEEVAGMTLLALWKIDAGDSLSRQIDTAAKIYSTSAASVGDLRWRAAYFLMRVMMGLASSEKAAVNEEDSEAEAIETALASAAADADPLIRSYAARGLGASKSAISTQTLLDLAQDDDWRVRVNAFNGLKTRRVEVEGPAKQRWRVYKRGLSDKNAGVALSALAALESCGGDEAGTQATKALKDKRPRFREVAALALAGRIKASPQPSVERLTPLTSDPVWSVRARAAEALAIVGGPGAVTELGRLARDPDPRVRASAVENIAKLQPGALAFALDDEDLFVRAAALDALAPETSALEDKAGGPVKELAAGYRRALADPQNDARLAALSSLAKVGGPAARAEIEKALMDPGDPDYLVRRRAATLLRDTFHVDMFSKVGEPAVTRSPADYLEAVARARRHVTATFETASGMVEVELLPAEAPLTVDNFMRLAREGRFDGLAFHRVVPNFVIQDGDPRGDGNGGPPWQIRCEINLHRYGTGAVGMALSGKDTGGSQYFMTHSPQPHLDGGYTIFGQVTSGQEVVGAMLQGDAVRRVTVRETP